MNAQLLQDTIKEMFSDHKGLLAMDESFGTCNKRFAEMGIPQTEEMRRQYRELIVTTPNLNASIGGAILFDETIRQSTLDGKPFVQILSEAGIVPGIKVDDGAKSFALHEGENITEGLDGLRERLAEYGKLGARFAKWRAVVTIGKGLPSWACLEANAHALARYAGLCQEANIVPIVEPEVLMEGDHSLERCSEVTEEALHAVFRQLERQGIALEAMVLKPNMVLPGLASSEKPRSEQVADATISCFLRTVPAATPAIAFLSGGQSPSEASGRLNAMICKYLDKMPWALAFSYSRAVQQPALKIWKGSDSNVSAAQAALSHRAHLNRLARKGEYTDALEH